MHNQNVTFFGMHFLWWIFIIVVVLAILYFIGYQEKNTPLEILKKRFAKGEITKDEFEKLTEILKKNHE